MKTNRNYITPFISITFFVVGISGLLMFFHLFDGYTEVLHEILGLFFFVCAIFHVILNWRGLRPHFKKKVFLPTLLSVLVISVVIIIGESLYPPVDLTIIRRVVKAPIHDAFQALSVDYMEVKHRLLKEGIIIENAQTIEDIWIINDADPEEVIDLIVD